MHTGSYVQDIVSKQRPVSLAAALYKESIGNEDSSFYRYDNKYGYTIW